MGRFPVIFHKGLSNRNLQNDSLLNQNISIGSRAAIFALFWSREMDRLYVCPVFLAPILNYCSFDAVLSVCVKVNNYSSLFAFFLFGRSEGAGYKNLTKKEKSDTILLALQLISYHLDFSKLCIYFFREPGIIKSFASKTSVPHRNFVTKEDFLCLVNTDSF